jgi:hypothetical protein
MRCAVHGLAWPGVTATATAPPCIGYYLFIYYFSSRTDIVQCIQSQIKSPATVLAVLGSTTFSLPPLLRQGRRGSEAHRERERAGEWRWRKTTERPSAAELPVSLSLMRLVPALHRSAMLSAPFLTQPCSQLLLLLTTRSSGWRLLAEKPPPLSHCRTTVRCAAAGWAWIPPPARFQIPSPPLI